MSPLCSDTQTVFCMLGANEHFSTFPSVAIVTGIIFSQF